MGDRFASVPIGSLLREVTAAEAGPLTLHVDLSDLSERERWIARVVAEASLRGLLDDSDIAMVQADLCTPAELGQDAACRLLLLARNREAGRG